MAGHVAAVFANLKDFSGMWPFVVNRLLVPVRHRYLARRVLCPLLALLIGVWQPGLAHARVESAWQDNAPRDKSYTRVLVVGLSPNYNIRCEFEWFMVSQIRSDATDAVASCDHMRSTEKLTVEAVAAIVKQENVDAVLTTQLVAASQKAEVGGSDDTRGAEMYKAVGTGYETGYYGNYGYYGGFGGFGIPVTYVEFESLPPITTIEGKVSVISMLFETADNTLVYEVKVTAKNLGSTDAALAAIADPTAKRLRKHKLIR
jgi:hypothetical protein